MEGRLRVIGRIVFPAVACGLMAVAVQVAMAQEQADAPPEAAAEPAAVEPAVAAVRGAGGGLAILPLVCWWLLALGWVATTDWLSRDSVRRGFSPAVWGPAAAFSFPVIAVIAWWVPFTWAALLLTALAWLVPVLAYVGNRNPKVPQSDRVLTIGHAKRLSAPLLERFGIEVQTMDDSTDDLLPTVVVRTAGGKDAEADAALMEKVAAAAGYADACKAMQSAVAVRSSRLRFDVAADAVHVHQFVDGTWVKPRVMTARGSRKAPEQWADVPSFSRVAGDAVLVVLKAVAGINPRGKGRQEGAFAIDVDGKPRSCRLIVQTATTGEQVLAEIETKAPPLKTAADLGMPAAVVDGVGQLLTLEKGILLLSSPPASGLSATFDVVIGMADRLVRDFISIEDAAAPANDIQNVKPIRYDAAAEQTPLSVLQKALLEYPAAIITRDLRDPALAVELVRLADEEKFVAISLKAASAIEAITKLLACQVPVDQLGRSLLGSLSQRLVRKLCPKCREAYPAPPEMIKRLNLAPTADDQPPQLYRASSQGCRLCGGVGYLGRTAVFELASGPTVRKAIAAQADPQTLGHAALKDGMVPLRDAGMRLVADGVTSLEELQRVFAAAAAKKPAPGVKRP